MTKEKYLLAVILFFTIITSSVGQNIKYKDVKDDFSTKNYRGIIHNVRYSPGIAVVGNYILPGIGYVYVQEPLRGVLVFGGQMAAVSLFVYGLVETFADDYSGDITISGPTLMLTGLIASGIIQVWSIFDVIKIAKIKNLAYYERDSAIKIRPDLNLTGMGNTTTPVLGVNLSFTF